LLAGKYTITNLGSGLNLDTQNGGTFAGTLVDQAAADGSQTQTWKLAAADAGLYGSSTRPAGCSSASAANPSPAERTSWSRATHPPRTSSGSSS